MSLYRLLYLFYCCCMRNGRECGCASAMSLPRTVQQREEKVQQCLVVQSDWMLISPYQVSQLVKSRPALLANHLLPRREERGHIHVSSRAHSVKSNMYRAECRIHATLHALSPLFHNIPCRGFQPCLQDVDQRCSAESEVATIVPISIT